MALIDFESNRKECEVVNRFLDHSDENSFTALFRLFSPQLVNFFRRRGHEMGVAENLAQEVMLTVHQRACRHFAKRMREGPTVDLADMGDRCADPSHNAAAPQS